MLSHHSTASDSVLCSNNVPLTTIVRCVLQQQQHPVHGPRQACNLLLVSRAFRAAVLESCCGVIPLMFITTSLTDFMAMATWLSTYGRLVKTLHLCRGPWHVGVDSAEQQDSSNSALAVTLQEAVSKALAPALQQAADAALACALHRSGLAAGGSAAAAKLHLATSSSCQLHLLFTSWQHWLQPRSPDWT